MGDDSCSALATQLNVEAWKTIKKRMSQFVPPIDLDRFYDPSIDGTAAVCDYATQGINFSIDQIKSKELVKQLTATRTHQGKQAFKKGRWKGAKKATEAAVDDLRSSLSGRTSEEPWALDVSLSATNGIGFREIWYIELSDHELRMKEALGIQQRGLRSFEPSPMFDSQFGIGPTALDLSAVHWSIGDADKSTGLCECNVHIDLTGITAANGDGVFITPNLLRHTFVELFFRTNLHGHVPDWLLQHTDFILPASADNYSKTFGVQVNAIDRQDLRLSFRTGCALESSGHDCFFTVNLGGKMNWLGGK